jgi:hypothetical protein
VVRLLEYLFFFVCSEQRQFCSVRSKIRAVTPTTEYPKYIKLVCGPRKTIFQKLSLALAAILSLTSSAHAQTITQQPTSQTVNVGQTAVFSVGFSGGPCRSYWYTGAIGDHYGAYSSSPISFSIPNTTSAMNGTTVLVNLYGCTGGSASVTSSIVGLTVASQSVLTVSTTSLPNATESVAYSQSLAAAGGASPYSWSLSSGTLPTGLSLSSAGAISGSTTVTGTFPFTVLVKDAAAHSASANLGINAVTAAAPSQSTIWPSTVTPTTPDVGSDSSVELGVRFYSDTSGYITGVRFYKSAANTGTHVGNLWSSTGTLLATAPFTSETASGWQQVNFSSPVAIIANTAYVASYHSTIGHYSVNNGYFASSAFNNPPLHTYVNTTATPEAPYTYGSTSAFPTSTYTSANYWVDVLFSSSTSGGTSLKVGTTSLPNATKSVTYSQSLAASGGSSPYSWSLSSGSLPTGLGLSSSGTISGTPTVAGTSPFTVIVKDSASASASANLSINVVTAAAPAVSINSPVNGVTVSGTLSVSGTASDGITISSVQVSVDGGSFSNASGTTSWSFLLNTNSLSNGAHTLTAKVSDSGGNSATSSLVDVTVNNASTSTDCTLYASPSGGGNGASSSSPLTFSAAASATQPGSVVCLLGGTYNLSSTFVPPNSGSPSSWIVYKNYDSTPVNFVWTGAADAEPMFKVGNGSFPSGPAYIQFQGLNLNGSGTAADGFFCRGGHHARFIGNSISDTGGSGIGSINCDYLIADHNLINHNGYIPSSTSVPQYYSWTSAISYNTSEWYDNYTGIHSVISNNTITGEVDQSSNHTDGNGIILDLGGNTPPALIVNNVVYGNGGRCIEPNQVQNFYVINNTCYKNALDSNEPNFPEFGVNGSSNGYVVNNIALTITSGNPGYAQYNSVSGVGYYANMYDVGAPNFSASGFINANPLFLAAPSLVMGSYTSSLAPSLLGTGLTLLPTSPAYGKGIDPSTISGLGASIVSDLKTYIYTDINGTARPQGGGSDLGAYQH